MLYFKSTQCTNRCFRHPHLIYCFAAGAGAHRRHVRFASLSLPATFSSPSHHFPSTSSHPSLFYFVSRACLKRRSPFYVTEPAWRYDHAEFQHHVSTSSICITLCSRSMMRCSLGPSSSASTFHHRVGNKTFTTPSTNRDVIGRNPRNGRFGAAAASQRPGLATTRTPLKY